MNKFYVLHACAAAILLASACNGLGTDPVTSGQAEVSIALTADGSHNPKVKSQAEETLPDIGDFTVEIFKKESGKRLYRDTYSNSTNAKIRLNAGGYKLLAWHGDSLASGFKSAYYEAAVPFEISAADRRVNVSGTAKLANVKVSVNHGATLVADNPGCYTRVTSDKPGTRGYLQFVSDETRAGFLPAGTLAIEVYAPSTTEGQIKYFKTTVTAEPNDYITLDIDSQAAEGKLTVGIIIDKQTETVSKTIVVDATDISTDTPTITLNGDIKSSKSFYEGDEMDGNYVSIVSPAGYSHAWLDITSDWLSAKGVPSRIDLCNLDSGTKAIFEGLGIKILEMKPETRFSSIDFGGMTYSTKLNLHNGFSATFKLTVTDKNGKEAVSAPFSVTLLANNANLNLGENNAFSRSLRKFSLNVTAGKPEKYTIQYRTAGGTWKNISGATVSGNSVNVDKLSGLNPSTTYEVRAIYNGNPENATSPVTITTENAGQVGNSSFEEWTTETLTISVALASDRQLDWYQPFSDPSTAWWAVTSRASMPTSILATTKTSVKSFPSVAYSRQSTEGSFSAHIYSVNVGRLNTDLLGTTGTVYAGDLFIGKADDSGKHISDGHAFSSRPDRFTFDYHYAPVENEKFYVAIEFQDAAGNVIKKEEREGNAASSWTEYAIDLNWDDISRKAGKIYIQFKSSSSSSPSYKNNTSLEVADNSSQGGHFGSSLFVDNLKLIYE